MSHLPEGMFLEIVERRPPGQADPEAIVPNQVRINGIPLLVPDGQSIKIHEIELGDDVVMVTLTAFAKRVTIGIEESAQ